MNSKGANPPQKRPFWSAIMAPFQGLSLPARASLVLGLFLVLLVVVAWTSFLLNPAHVAWRHAISWTRIAAVVALVFLTPVTFYWALRFWLVGYRSRFPDIDYAWKAGIEALKRNGISLKATPVFLVVGLPSPELEEAIMDACGREFTVRGVPEGPAPLHWYANLEAIYLVCSEAGWLSRVNRVVHQQIRRTKSLPEIPAEEA
jgi:hypothetical protein